MTSLTRFTVTSPFGAWSPGDRDRPERRISISPGPKSLFTDEAEKAGVFVKFLKNGLWYEADRAEFKHSTIPRSGPLLEGDEEELLSEQRGA